MHKNCITLANSKNFTIWQLYGVLVLGSCFLRLYAPMRFPSKRKRAAIGKILELPGTVGLCNIQKWVVGTSM
ncbi:hypothetical protein D7V86_13250 [bacterium D16-51]|nr:hypothetical protein D7V96_17220 [bacterium D16-59]RKI59312.1 hypothetical protein D7V86_13250 [bacterium D16-51]